MNRIARNLTAIVGVFVVAGCSQLPVRFDLGPARPSAPPATTIGAEPVVRSGAEGAVPAGQAEAACMAQVQQQGLAVQGVVGTREVTRADGAPSARDVMLRVARGQQVYEVRCNYSYAGAEARIMSL